MQKDFHFYIQYLICVKCGMDVPTAEIVAWANQFTDECQASIDGIQTASDGIELIQPQMQLTVLVPFHFLPGDDPKNKWMVTPNSELAKYILPKRIPLSPFEWGIALHSLQDTFSHQRWSGRREELNDIPWDNLLDVLPAVGHAKIGKTCDIINGLWTDPRSGEVVDNTMRAIHAARATAEAIQIGSWDRIGAEVRDVVRVPTYEGRKLAAAKMAGREDLSYPEVAERMIKNHMPEFRSAAMNQLSLVMGQLARR
jgi:hypothetical protein